MSKEKMTRAEYIKSRQLLYTTENKTNISFEIPTEARKKFEEEAKENGVSLSDILRAYLLFDK